jgi:trafficking protein particle complex subunit 9
LSTYFILISYSQASTLVVTDEPLEFVLTLYNPYVFDFEIQNLSLR